MSSIRSFPPIVSSDSQVLILGSMPGRMSLEAGQYYAHPQNAFWRIMGRLFDAGPEVPYEQRVSRLQKTGVALWDSLEACIRPGSLDANITDEVANDFPQFFGEHPSITHVFFNGSKAETVFRRRVLPSLRGDQRVYARLPSTSPAHAGMTFEKKVEQWTELANALSHPIAKKL